MPLPINRRNINLPLRRVARRLFFKLCLARESIAALANGKDLTEKPFDAGFYLRQYPDIAAAGIDPYEHFIVTGRKEGRIPAPPSLEYSGALNSLDPERKTVLVVSHEASRTGAPILSLNIVRELKKKYNVITLLLGGGAIVDDFRRTSDVVIGPITAGRDPDTVALILDQLVAQATVTFAIVNSIESRSVLPALARLFIPAVTLIHEFAASARPRNAFPEAVFWSTETIFSASVTRESAILECPDLSDCHFRVIPQGRCMPPFMEREMNSRLEEEANVRDFLRPRDLPADTIVVLGAGTVEIRKGIDLFIACAAKVVQSNPYPSCRFIWIGGGYCPELDGSYSLYLADQVRRSGLQQHFLFLDETPSIESAYQVADIFVLSPRLDPLPNVAIEAMSHGLPVICFEKATGIAGILIENGFGDECVAPYFDTSTLASKVLAFARSKDMRHAVGKRLQHLVDTRFSIERYVQQLEELSLRAKDRITQEQVDILEIIKSGCPRLDFYFSPGSNTQKLDEAVRLYVRSWASGVWRRKLFPGFHPGIFLEHRKMEQSEGDPLANYLRAGQPDGPWCHDIVESDDVAPPLATIKTALHIHVYYPDLLAEITARLGSNDTRPDLFVSVPSERARDEVASLLTGYSGNVIDIRVVPNSGRDIGAFFTAFGSVLVDRYDVIGHLHTKKSSKWDDEQMGRAWLSFP